MRRIVRGVGWETAAGAGRDDGVLVGVGSRRQGKTGEVSGFFAVVSQRWSIGREIERWGPAQGPGRLPAGWPARSTGRASSRAPDRVEGPGASGRSAARHRPRVPDVGHVCSPLYEARIPQPGDRDASRTAPDDLPRPSPDEVQEALHLLPGQHRRRAADHPHGAIPGDVFDLLGGLAGPGRLRAVGRLCPRRTGSGGPGLPGRRRGTKPRRPDGPSPSRGPPRGQRRPAGGADDNTDDRRIVPGPGDRERKAAALSRSRP